MTHYVYKITNLNTGLFYIGSRTHPFPESDGYMGSSKVLKKLYELEGINNFKKEILKIFKTRKKANSYENHLIKQYLESTPELVYNLRIPGGFKGEIGLYNKRRDLWEDYYHDIRNSYKLGLKIPSLAKKYNCDVGTIHSVVEDLKVNNKWSNAWKHQSSIIIDYNLGYSRKFLSKKYKCDINTITTILKENDITIRSIKEQHKQNKQLKITPGKKKEVNIELLKKYYIDDDLTVKQVAIKLGVGIDTLKRIIKENDIPLKSYTHYNSKPRHPAWSKKEEIVKDLESMSKKEILKKYKIKDYSTLNKIISS
jgi:Mor family transcriptional regulator